MSTILIPTDFSENAKKAVDYGLQLFSGSVTKVILLHATYIHYTFIEVPSPILDSTGAEAQEGLAKEADRIRAEFPEMKLEIETFYGIGDIPGAVVELEKKNKIDFIVMGTKGANNLVDSLVGSRTTQVIQRVHCPVLVVPDNCTFKTPVNILYASDHVTSIQKVELQPLIDLAKHYEAEVTVLHVAEKNEVADENSDYIKTKLEYHLLPVNSRFETISGEDATQGIDRFLEDQPADLLFMVTHRGNLFHRLFHKSVTKKLAIHSDIPMLITHHEA